MHDSPNVIAGILLLILVLVAIVGVLRFFRMADDIQKIREHLDRAIPDFVKANKQRIRENLKPEPPA